MSRERGHRQTAPGSCSEPHPSLTDHRHVQPPQHQQLHQPLPAAPPRPGKEQAAHPKASRSLGGSPRAQIPPGAHIKLSLSTGDSLELPLGAAVRHLLHQGDFGGTGCWFSSGCPAQGHPQDCKGGYKPCWQQVEKQEVGRPQLSSKPTNEPLFLFFSREMASPVFVWNSQSNPRSCIQL